MSDTDIYIFTMLSPNEAFHWKRSSMLRMKTWMGIHSMLCLNINNLDVCVFVCVLCMGA